MIQIRSGVFETNSSSVHSLCICSENEYKCWAENLNCIDKNSYLFDDNNNSLVPIEEILSEIPIRFEDAKEIGFSCINHRHYMTQNEYYWYCNNNYFEGYEEDFMSPSGDKMVAFGHYGHD